MNVFNPPVPHYDAGGITQRRGSRPPVDPYDTTRKSSNDRISAYSQPLPIQQPPVAANISYMTPQPNFQPQPPVSIFTPEYSSSSGYAGGVPAPPPPGGYAGGVPAPPPPGPMASSGNGKIIRRLFFLKNYF